MISSIQICVVAVGFAGAGQDEVTGAYIPAGMWLAASQFVAEQAQSNDDKLATFRQMGKIVVIADDQDAEVLDERNGIAKVRCASGIGYLPTSNIALRMNRWEITYDEVKDLTIARKELGAWRFEGPPAEIRAHAVLIGEGKSPKSMSGSLSFYHHPEKWYFMKAQDGLNSINADFLVNDDIRFTEKLEFAGDIFDGGVQERMTWLPDGPARFEEIAASKRAFIQIFGDKHEFTDADRALLAEMASLMKKPATLLKRLD